MTQGYPHQQPGPGQGAPNGGQYPQPPQAGYGVPQSGYQPAGYPQPVHSQHQGYPQQGWGAPPAVAPNGQPLAEQTTRLLARLIDGLIIGGAAMVVFIPVIVLVVILSAPSVETTSEGTAASSADAGVFVGTLVLAELGLFVFIFVLQYLYDVEFAKRTGQTVGKRLMKIRIVPLDPQQQVSRGVLAKRWLVSGPGGLIPGLSMVNVLWCLWDKPYRQCLHDKFASTAVVKVPG